MLILRRLCVYCGASTGNLPAYRTAAEALGTLLAQEGITLVYGGGHVGLMGAIADACLRAGGQVIGVIPQALADKEVAHLGLTELYIVPSMHERKHKMAELADAFVALPGGIGTLEELIEVLTWQQLGFHNKPIAVLNVAQCFTPLRALLTHMVQSGFLRPAHAAALLEAEHPADLLAQLRHYTPPPVASKWLDSVVVQG